MYLEYSCGDHGHNGAQPRQADREDARPLLRLYVRPEDDRVDEGEDVTGVAEREGGRRERGVRRGRERQEGGAKERWQFDQVERSRTTWTRERSEKVGG